MKVVLSTAGRFHMFALARELMRNGVLDRIYSGFPWRSLAREKVDRARVRTFPYVRPIQMVASRSPVPIPRFIMETIHHLSLTTIDAFARATLPECDIFVGHEGAGLWSGRAAKERGALYVCDRGCSHMGWKENLLQDEYARVGLTYPGLPRTFQREMKEYELADLIVVPSTFARNSFVASGFDASSIATIPYGVDLDTFHPAERGPTTRFEVLFVGALSVRKGAHDLLAAFRVFAHPRKRLTIAGLITKEIRDALSVELRRDDVRILGAVPHADLRALMCESDVLVLPSIEDGFGMVLVEALGCGCPIIGTTNTGAPDLIRDGVEGYIVPIRSPDAIADRLQHLADNPDLREEMRRAAGAKARSLSGWQSYGDQMVAAYQRLLDASEERQPHG